MPKNMHKKCFFIYVYKMSQSAYLTYYQRNKELISAKSKEYYQKHAKYYQCTGKRKIV